MAVRALLKDTREAVQSALNGLLGLSWRCKLPLA